MPGFQPPVGEDRRVSKVFQGREGRISNNALDRITSQFLDLIQTHKERWFLCILNFFSHLTLFAFNDLLFQINYVAT